MNKIARLSVFGVALSLFHSIAYCGDASTGKMDFFSTSISPSANATSLSEVAKGLKNQALLYASVVTVEGQASFKDIDPAFHTLPGTLHLMLNLKEYAYDYEPIHRPGDSSGAMACACDGTVYQELRKRDGKLLISKIEPSSSLPLQMNDFVFMPYAYFTNEERNGADPGYVLNVVDLADSSRWETFIAHMSLKGSAVVLGTQTVVVDLPLAGEAFTGSPGTVRYYLNPQADYFPMGWDAMDNSGRVLEAYRVTDLGLSEVKAGIQLPYPKTAIRQFFWRRNQKGTFDYFDKSARTQELDVSSFKVNSSLPEGSFKIDPSLANVIEDGTTGKFITVPK